MTAPNAYRTFLDRPASRPALVPLLHVLFWTALSASLLLTTACVSSGYIDAIWDLAVKPAAPYASTQPNLER